jgi:hypothetical protein
MAFSSWGLQTWDQPRAAPIQGARVSVKNIDSVVGMAVRCQRASVHRAHFRTTKHDDWTNPHAQVPESGCPATDATRDYPCRLSPPVLSSPACSIDFRASAVHVQHFVSGVFPLVLHRGCGVGAAANRTRALMVR